MGKKFECQVVGYDCDYTTKAKSESALMQKIVKHGTQVHNIREMTPEIMERVKMAISDA